MPRTALPLRLKCTKQSRWNLIFNSIWLGFLSCFVPAGLRFPAVIGLPVKFIRWRFCAWVEVSGMPLLLGRYEKLVRITHGLDRSRQYGERFGLEDISAGARVLCNLREH